MDGRDNGAPLIGQLLQVVNAVEPSAGGGGGWSGVCVCGEWWLSTCVHMV